MKFLVLGAGHIGYAMVYDLIRSNRIEQIIVADRDVTKLESIKKKFFDDKVVVVKLDVTKLEEVAELMSRCHIAVSTLPSIHNYNLTKAALASKTHFCDLGGNSAILAKQTLLHDVAKEYNITIIPNLGLAPGLVSILANVSAVGLDKLYEIRIRLGNIPVEPDALFKFDQQYSLEELLDVYTNNALIIRDGKCISVPALSDLEEIDFAKPIGKMEAFLVSGGLSDFTEAYAERVQHLDFKMIRYPGHCAQMLILKELGLMNNNSIQFEKTKAVPRKLLIHLMKDHLPKDEADVVLLRITITGTKQDKPIQVVWECIDYIDQAEQLSAYSRMTAFPASVIAQMVVRDDIKERGVLSPAKAVPIKLFLAELASRGINLTMVEREPIFSNQRPPL